MKSLHDEIMSIKYAYLSSDFTCLAAYVGGYKDARDEAAQLATNHDALMGELLEALEGLLYKVTDSRGVDIEEVYAADECAAAYKAIAKAKGEVK